LLHNLTANCISCHSAYPDKQNFPGADRFFSKVNLKELNPAEQAQMSVATRQFDQALQTYESIFASPKVTAAEVTMMDAFTDYLKVAIRVKGDLKRPITILSKWQKRPDTPASLRKQINTWIASLKSLSALDK